MILVLSDFDRTLSSEKDNFVVKSSVVEIVNYFSTKFLFFVVTGRERKYINILANGLKPTGWIIENGAMILLKDKEIKLADNNWFSTREKIGNYLKSKGIEFSFGEVIIYTNNAVKHRKILEEIKDAKVEWNRNDAMILPKNVSKGNAVKFLKEYLSFSGTTIAIGDSENDISLFEVADVRVAVSNALPEIKKIANIVLDKEDGEGVADFLKKILEGKLSFDKKIDIN